MSEKIKLDFNVDADKRSERDDGLLERRAEDGRGAQRGPAAANRRLRKTRPGRIPLHHRYLHICSHLYNTSQRID